ncbi:YnfA family protein [Moraxella osloensis]|uniref:YnfA family protein n=1 Tax=Faucicola osloensis TaxID=34062 RepID=UPI00200643FE|nr:YnfA family protein [Moraxella osloensis]MCK6053513.1 YnfA family protein [Moraxella osloensis]
MKQILFTVVLFAITAIAEIVGCYLGYQLLLEKKPLWYLIPLVISLAIFVWLLTLHPTATGRVYAAYGGIYVAVALMWLHLVDKVTLTAWDIAGGGVVLLGACIIIFQPYAFSKNF